MDAERSNLGGLIPYKRRKHEKSELVMQLCNAGPSEAITGIIIEILARLPLKLLADFRLLCKTWNDTLGEPYFCKVYARHAPTVLLLPAVSNIKTLNKLKIIDFTSDRLASYREASLTSSARFMRDFKFITMNSCNGLICLCDPQSYDPISILDPIRGKYIKLPKPINKSTEKVVSGFGHDPFADSYKIIRIFHAEAGSCSSNRWSTEILDFSNKAANWTRATDPPYRISTEAPGVFLNGAMHWLVDESSRGSELICSFNFHSGRFGNVRPPLIFDVNDRNAYYWSNLGVTGGNLSICAVDAKTFRPDFEVWVLEGGAWTKRLSIVDPVIQWWDPRRGIQVINFLRNGNVVILCCHELLLIYDPKDRMFISAKAMERPVVAHVPGFITLNDVVRNSKKRVLEIKSLCAKGS